jgi:hypothetical protein
MFAEMAVPGTTFEGEWHEVGFLSQPEIARALRASHRPDVPKMFAAANAYAERLLAIQRNYAEISGMAILKASMAKLEARLAEVRESANRCVLPITHGPFSRISPFPRPAGLSLWKTNRLRCLGS